MNRLLFTLVLFFSFSNIACGDEIALDELVKKEGFINFYLDEDQGKIFLAINNLDEDFLYLSALTSGIGSNDIGLDRGQLGGTRVVAFRKSGNKVFLVHKNMAFRASSDNVDEVQSIQDAFAESILWGFDILQKEGDSLIVEATKFYLQDTHGVVQRLSRTDQGTYKPDASRSGLHFPMVKNFPKNTEVEATITLTGKATGAYVKSVVPSPNSITVRQRHSFVQLPDDEYTPRLFDPRAGFNRVTFMDFATPIAEPIKKRYITRHRLIKKDPSSALSEAVEPIVYYLDPGTPEPVKSALLEGGNWWNQAFESAGFKNAFRVEIAPQGMDFLDVRYNVIQWVHRSTRGWSYGASVRDPRTGEILKGHVSLGSLRVRQDYLIAQGLLQPFGEGGTADNRMLELAVARLKQLSAHEIGHTIGLAHNFASSAVGRASVMDYPYPLTNLDTEGNISLSNAYDDKIGIWDKRAISYGYSYPTEGIDEASYLEKSLQDTYADGYEFITDADARDSSGVHPRSHLWDNGASAADELKRMLALRDAKMASFNLNAIPTGQPEATLEEVFVPLYLMHRYQLEATTKLIGGMDYSYKIKGDNQPNQGWVSGAIQQDSLDALLLAIEPDQLEVPEHILALIPPRPFGYPRNRETFVSRMGPIFDPIAPAENVVDVAFKFLLEGGRANRVYIQQLQDDSLLGLNELLQQLSGAVFSGKSLKGISAEIKRMTQAKLVDHLIVLANNQQISNSVRATVRAHLKALKNGGKSTGSRGLVGQGRINSTSGMHAQYLTDKIEAFINLPMEINPQNPVKVPDGSPIGMDNMTCDFEY
tara:strand:- start:5050 stop:7503 length:2454 start_codon:yes stop_codon:yes gene_type:complete